MFRQRKTQNQSTTTRAIQNPDETDEPAEKEDDQIRHDIEEKTIKRVKVAAGVFIENEKPEHKPKEPTILSGSALEEFRERADRSTISVQDIEQPKRKFGFIKETTVTDFKPDICKDYKDTGFCGFGDTCIYLHDRTNYLAGNELDKRWDDMMKKRSSAPKMEIDKAAETNCPICKRTMTPPFVRTRCGHLFCRECALNRFKTRSTCAVCSMETLGIFNDVRKA